MVEGPITKKPGQKSKGFSDEMAKQINNQQMNRVTKKFTIRQIRPSKPGQGYNQHRPGVDKL